MAKSIEFELLETWLHQVWLKEDISTIDDMFPGGKVTGLGAQTNMSTDAFKQFHAAICQLMCKIDVSIDKSMQDGPWLSTLCTLKADCKNSNKEIVITGTIWCRIEGGQILEAYNHFDFMSLWEQLGLLPVGCFEKGLGGEKIA